MSSNTIARSDTSYVHDEGPETITQRLAPGMHTPAAVAARLNITRRRVYVLAAGGALPCVRMGGQVRFNGEIIEQWIANGGSAYPGKE